MLWEDIKIYIGGYYIPSIKILDITHIYIIYIYIYIYIYVYISRPFLDVDMR